VLKVPPTPVVLNQVPPSCSPVIKEYKSIGVVEVLQTVITPSNPAFGCADKLTTATLVSLTHGGIP
jgi:hypothetical protein